MALPVLEKDWEFKLNYRRVYGGDSTAHYSAFLYDMKEAWTGWGSGAMTVAGCSDAVSNVDWTGTDYWTGPTFGSNNYPWIVLNMSGGGQIMLTRNTTSYTTFGYFSPGGLYTGGALNTPPSASDERALWTNKMFGGDIATADIVWQFWHSTDGDYEIAMPFANNNQLGWLWFGRLANAVDGWEGGRFYQCDGTSNNINYTRLNFNDTCYFTYDSAWHAAYLSGLGNKTTMLGTQGIWASNQWTGKAPFCPIGFVCRNLPAKGWHGRVVDLFWANNATYTTGQFYEEDPDNPLFQFVQVECLIFPWDGVETTLVTV